MGGYSFLISEIVKLEEQEVPACEGACPAPGTSPPFGGVLPLAHTAEGTCLVPQWIEV
jgi:hypothetical protein